jgi:hypothetical protein
MWIGRPSGRATRLGTEASTQATNPFMSTEPRPTSRSPSRLSRNGSLVQVRSSAGTTSRWPDST